MPSGMNTQHQSGFIKRERGVFSSLSNPNWLRRVFLFFGLPSLLSPPIRSTIRSGKFLRWKICPAFSYFRNPLLKISGVRGSIYIHKKQILLSLTFQFHLVEKWSSCLYNYCPYFLKKEILLALPTTKKERIISSRFVSHGNHWGDKFLFPWRRKLGLSSKTMDRNYAKIKK